MTNLIINGATGHMGRILCSIAEEAEDLSVAARVSRSGADGTLRHLSDYSGPADIVIDFSNHAGTKELMDYCVRRSLPVVVCTTGHTEEEQRLIDAAAKEIPVFQSGNMSVGIALLTKLVRETAAKFHSDIEIVEIHHNRKLDAPSGTALMLAHAAQEARPELEIRCGRSGSGKRPGNELGIQSVRMGNIVGTHEVLFSTATQTITLRHEALDRALFADGAVDAARFLIGKPAGMYHMNDLVSE